MPASNTFWICSFVPEGKGGEGRWGDSGKGQVEA